MANEHKSSSQDRPLDVIPEDKNKKTSTETKSEKTEKTETKSDDKPLDRRYRTSRRVSQLFPRRTSFFGFEDVPTDTTAAETEAGWRCATYEFSPEEESALPTAAYHRELAEFLGESNEDFELFLQQWLADKPEGITIGNALNYTFEYMRYLSTHCSSAYNYLLNETAGDRVEIDRLRALVADSEERLRASEQERGEMIRALKDLPPLDRKKTTVKPEYDTTTVTVTPGERRVVTPITGFINIEVPKQYRPQLVAAGLSVFEGGTDPDTVFTFIKALEYAIDMLSSVFIDAQCIEFASTYMVGSVRRWARQWKLSTDPNCQTWDRFLADFKHRWVPANAHVHLTSKLESMELKRHLVDQFNDEYRETLRMLDIHDLRKLRASDQYYKLYLGKIRDPTIRAAIQHHALITGGLNLEILMDYTSQLMLTAAAAAPVKSTTTITTDKVTRDNKHKKQAGTKAEPITINAIEDTKETSTKNRRWDRGTRPARRTFACFACGSAEHGLDECEDKAAFYEVVAARKTAGSGKD
ncbi:hypothetical protein BJ508DRAFT_316189 [Ascobolus immersus RN42]|uniref:Ty3 transposon capsid-like protein domain-containing protein n=1 Tax=Ascobolus immersus RN42 TaxID=1160509 RepID=A0A3N4HA74_ASCIM|nr:hypothetical protein BJ508DRAFT_316191 [Ascobolus immersus RN42]RPA70808.1 hypothetical protein BJ508DRAFT_316189 [Ascobolus immersus RN42]